MTCTRRVAPADRPGPPSGDEAVASAAWPPAIVALPRLWLSAVDAGARNVDATLQSVIILGRGLRAVDTTWRGLVCMTFEEEAATSPRTATPGPGAVVDLGLRLAIRRWSRQVTNAALITTLALQVAEDASVPLVRRAGDLLGGAVATA